MATFCVRQLHVGVCGSASHVMNEAYGGGSCRPKEEEGPWPVTHAGKWLSCIKLRFG